MTNTINKFVEILDRLQRIAFIASFFFFITVVIEIGAIYAGNSVFGGYTPLLLVIVVVATSLFFLALLQKFLTINEDVTGTIEQIVQNAFKAKEEEEPHGD